MRFEQLLFHNSKRSMSIILNNNNNQLGHVRFSPPCPITNQTTTAYLNSIYVNKKYQNNNIGSYLLKEMECYLKNNTKTNIIKSVLWNDNTNPFLSEFFHKNGYYFKNNKQSHYDDGEILYEIIPLEKIL